MAKQQGITAPAYDLMPDIVRQRAPALLTLVHAGTQVYSETFALLYRREAEAPNAIWQAEHTLLDIVLYRPLPSEIASCRTLFYTLEMSSTPRTIHIDLREMRLMLSRFVFALTHQEDEPPPLGLPPDRCALMIVDEADRLNMAGIEQLRDIYDRSNTGLLLIGMPGLEKRMSRYPQLYSRVGFAHEYRPLSTEEMHFILEHHWERLGLKLEQTDFSDREAVSAIARITGGNFRLIQRLFAQIGRILQINNLGSLTKEVVEAARACLVIGVT
jgi:hypothetical protein